jgi:hypothetical protein
MLAGAKRRGLRVFNYSSVTKCRVGGERPWRPVQIQSPIIKDDCPAI